MVDSKHNFCQVSFEVIPVLAITVLELISKYIYIYPISEGSKQDSK